jgi:hypothetical protein
MHTNGTSMGIGAYLTGEARGYGTKKGNLMCLLYNVR